MCAAVAGQRGRRVAVLDHNGQAGRKILVSGGGRCNFAKSALALFGPQDFVELIERHGISWHEKALGQLFCDQSARAILEMLLAECERGGVEIVLNADGIEVATSGGFCVKTSAGEFKSEALVVATGGMSIPKLGATGLGYELAQQFGLKVVEPRPALVPLLLGGVEADWTALAGVAAEVVAWVEKAEAKNSSEPRFKENMLVTHRGLSGPAVLQASLYWRPGKTLMIDFAPMQEVHADLLAALRQPESRRDLAALKQTLREVLPQRLANFLAEIGGPQGWSNAALEACERRLHRWETHPVGTEGFAKAEVTAGGVDTRGLQARTMEARSVPGLFFIGEVVDVTGQLGGFNFQWAWASGVAAGKAV
jgi:predicted Rossmann fold flavoprotein